MLGSVSREADVTELRQVVDDLMQVIDTAHAPIFGTDTNGHVTAWNLAAAEISGWTESETIGKPFVECFISEKHQPSVSEVFAGALSGRKTMNFGFPLLTKDGKRREMLINVAARRGPDGSPIGVIAVGQDITELRNCSAEQQQIAEDLARLIETANAPMFGVSVDGFVTEWNKKAAELSGYAKDETVGRPLVERFITDEYKDKVKAVLAEACKGTEVANFEFPLLTKDGRQIDILLNATTRRDAKGGVTGVVGVGQDITKLREAMNETKRVADDLTQLIDTANAPIFGIDTQGRVNEWNQKAAEVSGWAKADTLGEPLVMRFISESYRDEVNAVLTGALLGQQTANFEFPLFSKDNGRREILLNATTRRGPDGEVIGVIGIGQDITELRAMTAEQHRIADDFARLIETANAPIFGVGVDGRVTEWNRKAAELSGYSRQETINHPLVEDFITYEYKGKVQKVLTEACQGKEVANFEFPLLTKDGKCRDILLNATTRRDAKGDITGVVGVGQDITNFRRAMNEAKRVADDLTQLIDTANAPIFGIDTQGRVTEWNQKAAEVSGWTKISTIGKPLVECFISEDYRKDVNDVLTRALAGHQTANFKFPLYTKDNRRREILLNATARHGPDGEVTGVIGVGQDITELQAITAEQHRIADDLSRLIDTANAPIFGVSVDGLVTEWNKKAAELSGYSKEQTVGRPLVEDFITADYQESVRTVLTEACHGTEVANFEFPLLTEDGKRIDILLNATTRRDATGTVTGVVGVGQDITNLRQAMNETKRVADDLTRLIDIANAPIFGIDTDGLVAEWNQKAAEISGWQKSETLGKPLVDSFISSDYKESMHCLLSRALVGHETANFEFPLFTKDGRRREILLNATTRRGPDGEVTGVIGVGQDITELRAITAEQHRVADDLSRLIETANAPIFGVSVTGRVIEWNRKAAELTGYSKDETMGRQLVDDFITDDYQESVRGVLIEACHGNEAANFEFPLLTKQGKRMVILLNATTRRDATGEVTGVVGVGQNITSLRQAMNETKRVADDLTQLIDTANAPIFGIDTNGRVNEWNQKAADITGWQKDDTLGKPLVQSFISEDYKNEVTKVFLEALAGRQTANFELPLFTKDHRRRVILLNATTRRGPDGEVTGVIGVGQDITELRAITAEQHRIADDLARLIETANAPIFGVNTAGRVTEWNMKAAELSGYSKTETMERPLVQDFITDDYKDKVQAVLTQALRGNEGASFEFPLLTKDGKRIDILLNATTRRDANGDVTGVVGVGQDITNFRQAMNETKRVADDLSRLIETANAPIFGVSVEGRVTEWNRKAADLSGYSKEETMGRHLVENFITEEYMERVQNVLTEACQGREAANFEFPLLTKVGTRIDILLNATTRRNAKGEVTGVVGVGQDITKLRQAMDDTKRIADDLTQLIDTANAPIFGIDREGCVTEWNQKAAIISGWAQDETIGKPLVESFISFDYRDSVSKVLTEALAGRETANFEFPLFTKDGKRREILLNASTRRGQDGQVKGVIGVGQDITQLRAISAEQQRIADDLSRLIETANAPIFGVDIHGMVTEWNKKAAELSGFSNEETMGRPLVKDFITAEYQEKVQFVLTKACSGFESQNFEFPLVTKGGKRIHILLNATSRRDATGAVIGVVGVGQDITELGQALSLANSVADDLSRLIDTANAPIFGIDMDGRITEWNAMASKITGYDKTSAMGQDLVDNFINKLQQDEVREVLDRALRGEDVANFELPLYSRRGEVREILFNATSRRNQEGEIIGVVGVGQDITELNMQRREAERIASDLARLIDTANAPILGVNVQGRVTEWNRKAAELSGYCRDEIMGRPLVQSLVAEQRQEEVAFVILKALSGQESSDFQFALLTKSGEHRELLMNATTLRGLDGKVTGVIGVGHDLTEVLRMGEMHKNLAEDLARLVRSANAPIFGVNISGMVTEWNDKAAVLTGYMREEAMGKPLVETFTPHSHKAIVSKAIQDACDGIETNNFEFPLTHKEGSEVMMLLNAATRRDHEGRVVGMVGVGQDITTLRKALNEVSRTADDLRRIIEHANAPIFGIDTQGRVREWNLKVAEISGWSSDEMLGTPLVQTIIREQYREQLDNVFNSALSGVEMEAYEFPLFTKHGGRHEILFNATTRRGSDGQITGVLCVGQDITKLRALTKEHERIADDLGRLIETANAPIFGVDTEGRITEWNRKAVEISGYAKHETEGQDLIKRFIHKVHQRPVQAVLDQALTQQNVADMELALYTKRGDRRDILLSVTPRWGSDGAVVGVVCVGQDITELNRHRQKAERIAADLSRLIETANAPIFGVDNCMEINEWNGWVANSSGFSKADVQGSKLTKYIATCSHTLMRRVLQDAYRGKPTSNFEVVFISRNHNKLVCLLLNATPRLTPRGDIVGVICVGQDITSIKEIEQKKLSFMSMISHEFKSPLHGIIGLSDAMADNVSIVAPATKQLHMINSCAVRLLDMVNNTMDARMLVQNRRMRFSRGQVKMHNVVEEVMVLCKNSEDKNGHPIVKNGVELINEVTDLPTIEADPYRCTQVIYNLVTNALKFTHKGFVKVSAKSDDSSSQVQIIVHDTGIGIAQENLESIFQPFDQEDQSEVRAYDGLGLGLAICYEVAVKHGGSLNVESVQGEGSSFIVTLPYKMADLAEGKEDLIKDMDVLEPVIQAKSPRTGSKGELPKPTLCVDSDASSFGRDNSLPPTDASGRVEAIEPVSPGTMDAMVGFEQDCCHTEWSGPEGHLGGHADELVTILTCDVDGVNQGVTEATLSHCNFKVVACKNGVQCLKYIDECTTLPDVVLLDLMIGGLSGLDVLREIRRTYACTTLPIIMVSAENSTTAVTTGFRLACNDWLHKPFDRQELIARVRCQVLIKRHFKALEDTSVPCSVLEKLLPQHLAERLAGHGNLTDTELAAVKAEILQDMVPKAFDSTGPQGALASEDEAQRYKSCFAAAQKESARLQEQLTSLLTQEKKAVEEQKKASREQKELQQKYAMLQIELGHVREKYDAQCKETAQESSSVCDAIQPLPTGPSTDASLMALQLQHAHLQIELKARDRRLVHAQQLVKRLRAQGATHERRCGELAGELRQLKTPVAFPQFPGMSG